MKLNLVQVQQQSTQVQQQVQIQQQPVQVQTQQYAVIQDGLNNGGQQIFYMKSNSNDRVIVEQPVVQQSTPSQQPIVLNHQISQSNSIVRSQPNKTNPQQQVRAPVRQPLMQQAKPQTRQMPRAANTTQQVRQQSPSQPPQLKQLNSNQTPQLRVPNPAQLRQPSSQQQLRQQTPSLVTRPVNPGQQQFRPQNPNQVSVRASNPNQQPQIRQTNPTQLPQIRQPNQQRAINQQIPKNQKSSDEQEAVSLPDGSVVSMAVYKKMLVEQKTRALQQSNARQASARGSAVRAAGRGRGTVAQFTVPQQRPQPSNDPSRYAMMNQQQPINKPQPQQQFQNQTSNQVLQQQRQQQLRQSQANYVIQPPKPNQKPQQQRPLPSYIPSTQIQKIIESTPVGEEFSDSIRMLVLLENGEQRLITFTLPKEACTIQEILEQVNVPFRSDTNIQVTEANTNGINYIVTVGNVPNFELRGKYKIINNSLCVLCSFISPQSQLQPQPQPQSQLQPQPLTQSQPQPQPQPTQVPPCPTLTPQVVPELSESPTPEPPKELPKFVPGMLALCAACGYLSEDFAKCIRIFFSAEKNPLCSIIYTLYYFLVTVKPPTPTKKKPSKSSKVIEHESVVISSDEEEEDQPSKVSENILQKLGASITISPVTKEPSTNDIQRHSIVKPKVPVLETDEDDIMFVSTTIKCRTIRIGSYRFVPPEKVIVDSTQVIMQVPHPSKENDIKTIKIDKCEIVKVLASFNKALPVFFYYLNPALAKLIREELDMTPDGDYYYDPLSSKEEAYRRITLLPDDVSDEDKENFQLIYGCIPGILDELNVKEANDILIKTCPKELTKAALGLGSFTEIKQLLTYPPEGRGRISINTEDYVCLAQDQFLNDVIIDFYLKYLVENLPADQKLKVHTFSTFFYKRLTTKPIKASRKSQPSELDPTLTAAQKRHARVKTWTKNVNLFEKEFIIVPINENAHWFLAIICFPGMEGTQTWDGKPYTIEVKPRKKKKVTIATIGSVSVTAVKQEKVEKPIICEDPELSDKDEAEGDDSEPCILIFDSLAGASRSRVVATLRDYLTCEYKAKLGKEKIFNKDVIKGASPKVPQQNNFTDCGLYLLQYVEHFFTHPITDYNMPIKQIKEWFEEIIVTKKREDIAELIKNLMKEYGKDLRMLPDISFPTLNGKLVEREPEDEEEEEDEMMDDEEMGLEEEQEFKDESSTAFETSGTDSLAEISATEDSKEDGQSPMKPSSESVSNDFVSQTVLNPKPDISEFPRQTNRDTLSYLKAKRIIRHKNSDGPEMKKLKSDQMQ
ncbi:hypothetical protein NQ314_016048 [Rhamnusium bicolor]|uniref:Ubiquitin-like protease family profile domain-containing protein n=1 Tax=Rhamnusium bicolor TaxID=1586634 RepID=A0AAV8WX95_9CUCU|nr:hypothetical protein NQ314_016048 [Rhamnusium bicolor]